jgi:hypothetical protein
MEIRRVSPELAGFMEPADRLPAHGSSDMACPAALTAGKSRVSTLMHFSQIGQTIHRQLLGVPLPGSPEDFEISADFQPGICKPFGIKRTHRLVLVQNAINHLNHRKLRNKRTHCNSCSAAVWISDVKTLRRRRYYGTSTELRRELRQSPSLFWLEICVRRSCGRNHPGATVFFRRFRVL